MLEGKTKQDHFKRQDLKILPPLLFLHIKKDDLHKHLFSLFLSQFQKTDL
jgi:hypothetical protein